MEKAQALLNKYGGYIGTREPVVGFDFEEGSNLATAVAADGTYLGDIAFRPWDPALKEDGYLFYC